jgi:hypothetical protein
MARRVFAFFAFVAALLLPHLATAETRTALVIGNSEYSFGPLINPANDAKLMGETLTRTGFKVNTVLNADRQTMQRALLDFSRDIRDKETVGLFYFAGHGVQVNGQNYLIPVDADIKAESEVKIFGINVDEFVATLERADGRTNIVILDSCRNNPFGSAGRSLNKGLAAIDAPTGTFIAYSTAPGQIALDGEGANSPYATALAKALIEPNIPIEQAFKLTRRDVLNVTKSTQTPWESSSLTGDFVFAPKTETAPADVAKVEEKPVAPAEPVETDKVAVAEPQLGPAQTSEVRQLNIQPQIFPLGKWPEGLVIADNAIWIAESGSRRIVKIDPGAGDLLAAVNVGRLPVAMTKDADENVYAATFTDQKIFKQPPGGAKGKVIAGFKNGFIRGLSFGAGAVYVATSTEEGERTTVITRVEPKTGKVRASPPYAADTRAFIMAQDTPWILDTSSTVTMFETTTLKPMTSVVEAGFMWGMAANLDAVYVGGREQQLSGKSIVQRHAQGNPEDKLLEVLDSEELILAIAANDNRVAALGEAGTVWILDASSLKPLASFNTGLRPQAAVFENGNLFITIQQYNGENGALLIYEGVGNLN